MIKSVSEWWIQLTGLCGPNYMLNFNSALLCAVLSTLMEWVLKWSQQLLKYQVLRPGWLSLLLEGRFYQWYLFLSGFSHVSENTINKRCDWQLIRDSILAKIDNEWWWKSERDMKGQEKKIFLLLFFYIFPFLPVGEKWHSGLFYN